MTEIVTYSGLASRRTPPIQSLISKRHGLIYFHVHHLSRKEIQAAWTFSTHFFVSTRFPEASNGALLALERANGTPGARVFVPIFNTLIRACRIAQLGIEDGPIHRNYGNSRHSRGRSQHWTHVAEWNERDWKWIDIHDFGVTKS